MEKSAFTSIILSSTVLSLVSAGAFGSFGAMVQYLYYVVKTQEPYSNSRLFAYALMGFFVGMLANELAFMLLGSTYPGIVLISGFIFMKILDFLDGSKLVELVGLIIKK